MIPDTLRRFFPFLADEPADDPDLEDDDDQEYWPPEALAFRRKLCKSVGT